MLISMIIIIMIMIMIMIVIVIIKWLKILYPIVQKTPQH